MRRKTIAAGAGLMILVAFAYLPTAWAGSIWDDDSYLLSNPLVRTVAGLARIWLSPLSSPQYYPVVFSSYWLEYRLWGLDLAGYHAVNVALHALNALLIWRALTWLGLPGAWLAAAIFAVHPVHVESVAWITERKNVLSGFFYLSSLLAYWRFSPPVDDPEGRHESGRWSWYLLAFVLQLAALGSKTVTCSLPAAILLIAWWKRGTIPRRDVVALLPFFLVGALASSLTAWLERHHVGARGPEWSLSALDRGLIAGRALWFYAGKLACPVHLSFIYPRWHINSSTWWQYAYPVGIVAAVGALWAVRGRVGRGALAGVFFFAGTLLPALGFFDVYPMRYSFVADHFQYLASLGLIVPVSAVAVKRLRAVAANAMWVKPALAGGLICLLGTLTLSRALVFHDKETLWTDTAVKDPACWIARNNLGLIYMQRMQLEQARTHFVAALQSKPDYLEAHYNLGAVLEEEGNLVAADYHLSRALGLDPSYWKAHYAMGLVRKKEGRTREAAEEFRATLRLNPWFEAAQTQLALVAPGGRAAKGQPLRSDGARSDETR